MDVLSCGEPTSMGSVRGRFAGLVNSSCAFTGERLRDSSNRESNCIGDRSLSSDTCEIERLGVGIGVMSGVVREELVTFSMGDTNTPLSNMDTSTGFVFSLWDFLRSSGVCVGESGLRFLAELRTGLLFSFFPSTVGLACFMLGSACLRPGPFFVESCFLVVAEVGDFTVSLREHFRSEHLDEDR